MHVLGGDAFRTAFYLPTLAQGYKMDLMTSDAKNRYFPKKSQAILREEMAAVQEVMNKGEAGTRGYGGGAKNVFANRPGREMRRTDY